MTEENAATITVHQTYDASAERVFDAFLDPAIARRFLFATPKGQMISAEIDARVGGKYTFTERRPDMGDVRHIGEYLEIDRPRRLVFTFAVPQFDPRESRVTIEIKPQGASCQVTLTNSGVLPDYADGTRDGWGHILAGLLPAYEGIQAGGWPSV
jgi:uncharacterized protein YndB with AHSA1/START domain